MRLFLGFAPAGPEVRAVFDRRERLRGMGDLPLRWTPPENWHVTLHFLGEVADRVLEDLIATVAATAGRGPETTLRLEAAEWFPGFGKARLLALCGRASPELLALHDALGAELRRQGFRPERRAYRPHVTLARLRGPRKRFAPPALPRLDPVELRLSELTLFESVPGAGAPVYRPLHCFGTGT